MRSFSPPLSHTSLSFAPHSFGFFFSLCNRLLNERRLMEMAFVPVNLYILFFWHSFVGSKIGR